MLNRSNFIRRFVSGVIALPVIGLKNPLQGSPETTEPPDCGCCHCMGEECDCGQHIDPCPFCEEGMSGIKEDKKCHCGSILEDWGYGLLCPYCDGGGR